MYVREAIRCALVTLVAASGFFACNSILGIDRASPPPNEELGEASSDANSVAANCATYCQLMQQACETGDVPDADTEYVTSSGVDSCNLICAMAFPEPVAVSIDVRTAPPPQAFACRLWHAEFGISLAAAADNPTLAAQDLHFHCSHAGPLGGGLSGCTTPGPCDVFCPLYTSTCPQGDPAVDCRAACDTWAFTPSGDGTDVALMNRDLTQSGNTLNCRMYYLEKAVLALPNEDSPNLTADCLAASPTGGGQCVDSDP